jgi:hypothetical protein
MDHTNIDPFAPAQLDYFNPHTGEITMNDSVEAGSPGRMLLENELNYHVLRPWREQGRGRGRTWISKPYLAGYARNGKPIIKCRPQLVRNDTNATLRFLDWIQLDEAVVRAAKPRLRAAKDLMAKGLTYELPNGIAKTTLQFQQQSDITGAITSMDGLRQGERDRPVFSLLNFPLPIIHKDFDYPLRQLMASRTGYSPLDVTTAELAGRRVAEQVEQYTLGVAANLDLLGQASYTWNSGTISGYCNFPNRITYTITQPTAAGWIPQNTVDDILNMKRLSQQAKHFGPWWVYFGLGWDPYMDDDYKPTYNDTTLRQRIREIDGITDARTVDYIPDMSILLVQQTTDVVRMVKGMDITTVQWESHGGMQLNFKVMCVMIPQLRTDINNNTGIVHGS